MKSTMWVSNGATIFFLWMVAVVIVGIWLGMKEDKRGGRR